MSDKHKENEPPSLFDDLSLFAAQPAGATSSSPRKKDGEGAAKTTQTNPPPPPPPPPKPGLTGVGPMRDLFDFNFRQYSAYVICSRAIPALEDGLKPVQRRIMHSL